MPAWDRDSRASPALIQPEPTGLAFPGQSRDRNTHLERATPRYHLVRRPHNASTAARIIFAEHRTLAAGRDADSARAFGPRAHRLVTGVSAARRRGAAAWRLARAAERRVPVPTLRGPSDGHRHRRRRIARTRAGPATTRSALMRSRSSRPPAISWPACRASFWPASTQLQQAGIWQPFGLQGPAPPWSLERRPDGTIRRSYLGAWPHDHAGVSRRPARSVGGRNFAAANIGHAARGSCRHMGASDITTLVAPTGPDTSDLSRRETTRMRTRAGTTALTRPLDARGGSEELKWRRRYPSGGMATYPLRDVQNLAQIRMMRSDRL